MNESPAGLGMNSPGTYEILPSEDGIRPPPPSPLSGGYLLIVISEPRLETHKAVILQKISKAFLSWDANISGIDIEHELASLTALSPEGDRAKNGERLIQNASEHLVTEILIKPQINTLRQCIRNLLSSFTKYRYIIHAGYTFCGNGSWILEDGTFSMGDFIDAFHETEVQRVMRAYEKAIKVDICCISRGSWNQMRINQEQFSKFCRVEINPSDKLSSVNAAVHEFTDYLDAFIVAQDICDILQSSDIVGNIRFSRPTLYVFPGGDGDTALFGINGFNMLVDGGFNRGACFWNFVRHLDRLDAVLHTRINNTNIGGMSGIVQRKVKSPVYPQIGHFFSNLQRSKNFLSPDGNKDKDPLLIDLLEEGGQLVTNLKKLQLKPHSCYRESNNEPINLYHKVGHGKLDMYVLSPAKDSREVKDFLHRWHNHDIKLFGEGNTGTIEREISIPIQNLTSICALLVWQPANPEDRVTRILFPGSAPQQKVLEGFDRMKQMNFLKSPVCLMKSILPTMHIKATTKNMKIKKSDNERISHTTSIASEKAIPDDHAKKITSEMAENETSNHNERKMDDINELQSQKHIDRAPSSNQTRGFDMKEKHICASTEKLPTRDTAKHMDKFIESSTKSNVKKLDKKGLKMGEKKIKITVSEKKVESDKSSPTTPKKISTPKETPVKETSTKKITSSSGTLQNTTKMLVKTLPAKRLKDESNRRMAETKQEIQTTRPKSSAQIIEKVPTIISTETNKVIKKESSKPRVPSPVIKQTSDIDAVKNNAAPAIVKKSSDSSKRIEEKKKLSKIGEMKNKVTKKSLVVDTNTKESLVIAVKKPSKNITTLNKKNMKSIDDTKSSMTVSNIIRKEVEGNEDEILIIETTEMKPNDAMENIYEDNKYIRDEKESEKGTIKDQENNGQITAMGRSDSYIKSSEKKSVPDLLTPEQKEDISDQLQGIISTATEIVSYSTDSQAKENSFYENNSTMLSMNEVDMKQKTIETKSLILPADPNTEASSTIPPLLEKDTDFKKQGIEEKYDSEDIKEKNSDIENISPMKYDEQKKIDIHGPVFEKMDFIKDALLKTPDEVADLPLHEEADFEDTLNDQIVEQPIVAQVDELQLPEVVTITPTSSPDEKVEKTKEITPSDLTLMENLKKKTSVTLSLDDGDSLSTEKNSQNKDISLKTENEINLVITKTVSTIDQETNQEGEKMKFASLTNIHQENESLNQNSDFGATKTGEKYSSTLAKIPQKDIDLSDIQIAKEVSIEKSYQKEKLRDDEINTGQLLSDTSSANMKASTSAEIMPHRDTNSSDIQGIQDSSSPSTTVKQVEAVIEKIETITSSTLNEDIPNEIISKNTKITPDAPSKLKEETFAPSLTASYGDDTKIKSVQSSKLRDDIDGDLQSRASVPENISDIGLTEQKVKISFKLDEEDEKLPVDEKLSNTSKISHFLEKEESSLPSATVQKDNTVLQNSKTICDTTNKSRTEISFPPLEAELRDIIIPGDELSQIPEGIHLPPLNITSHPGVAINVENESNEKVNCPPIDLFVNEKKSKILEVAQLSTEDTSTSSSVPVFEEEISLKNEEKILDDKTELIERESFESSVIVEQKDDPIPPIIKSEVEPKTLHHLQSLDGGNYHQKAVFSCEKEISLENSENVQQTGKPFLSPVHKDTTPPTVESTEEAHTFQALQLSDKGIIDHSTQETSTSQPIKSEEEAWSSDTGHQNDISQQIIERAETITTEQSQSLVDSGSCSPSATVLKEDFQLQNTETSSTSTPALKKEDAPLTIEHFHKKEIVEDGKAPYFQTSLSDGIQDHSLLNVIVKPDTTSILVEEVSTLHIVAVQNEDVLPTVIEKAETGIQEPSLSLDTESIHHSLLEKDITTRTIENKKSTTSRELEVDIEPKVIESVFIESKILVSEEETNISEIGKCKKDRGQNIKTIGISDKEMDSSITTAQIYIIQNDENMKTTLQPLEKDSSLLSEQSEYKEKVDDEYLQPDIESGVRRTDPNYVSDISIKNFTTCQTDEVLPANDEPLNETKLKKESLQEINKQNLKRESPEDDSHQKHIKSTVSMESNDPKEDNSHQKHTKSMVLIESDVPQEDDSYQKHIQSTISIESNDPQEDDSHQKYIESTVSIESNYLQEDNSHQEQKKSTASIESNDSHKDDSHQKHVKSAISIESDDPKEDDSHPKQIKSAVSIESDDTQEDNSHKKQIKSTVSIEIHDPHKDDSHQEQIKSTVSIEINDPHKDDSHQKHSKSAISIESDDPKEDDSHPKQIKSAVSIESNDPHEDGSPQKHMKSTVSIESNDHHKDDSHEKHIKSTVSIEINDPHKDDSHQEQIKPVVSIESDDLQDDDDCQKQIKSTVSIESNDPQKDDSHQEQIKPAVSIESDDLQDNGNCRKQIKSTVSIESNDPHKDDSHEKHIKSTVSIETIDPHKYDSYQEQIKPAVSIESDDLQDDDNCQKQIKSTASIESNDPQKDDSYQKHIKSTVSIESNDPHKDDSYQKQMKSIASIKSNDSQEDDSHQKHVKSAVSIESDDTQEDNSHKKQIKSTVSIEINDPHKDDSHQEQIKPAVSIESDDLQDDGNFQKQIKSTTSIESNDPHKDDSHEKHIKSTVSIEIIDPHKDDSYQKHVKSAVSIECDDLQDDDNCQKQIKSTASIESNDPQKDDSHQKHMKSIASIESNDPHKHDSHQKYIKSTVSLESNDPEEDENYVTKCDETSLIVETEFTPLRSETTASKDEMYELSHLEKKLIDHGKSQLERMDKQSEMKSNEDPNVKPWKDENEGTDLKVEQKYERRILPGESLVEYSERNMQDCNRRFETDTSFTQNTKNITEKSSKINEKESTSESVSVIYIDNKPRTHDDGESFNCEKFGITKHMASAPTSREEEPVDNIGMSTQGLLSSGVSAVTGITVEAPIKISCAEEQNKEDIKKLGQPTKINSIPEIKLTAEKIKVVEENVPPIITSTTATSTTTTDTIISKSQDSSNIAQRNIVSDNESRIDDTLHTTSTFSHTKLDNVGSSENSSLQDSSFTVDVQMKSSPGTTDIAEENICKEMGSFIHEQKIEDSKDSNITDTSEHHKLGTEEISENLQIEHHLTSKKMTKKEEIRSKGTTFEIYDENQDSTSSHQSISSAHTVIAEKRTIDPSFDSKYSNVSEFHASSNENTSITSKSPLTFQKYGEKSEDEIEDASTQIYTAEANIEDGNFKNRISISDSIVAPGKTEEQTTAEFPLANTCVVSPITSVETETVSLKIEKKELESLINPLANPLEIYPTTVNKSMSELQTTGVETLQTNMEVTSPALQLDASAMYVKFTSGTTDIKEKIISMEDADGKKKSIPTLSSKANSEDIIIVSENSNTMLEKKESVAKTISLPILDAKDHLLKEDEEHIDLKTIPNPETDFSKSYPCLKKISSKATSVTSSDPIFDEHQPDNDLKSKSVSLPVIKRLDDSDKYMELPHLHKIENLEDLTSVEITEEVNSDGTIETITTTINTIGDYTAHVTSSILMPDSSVTTSNIDPIKEADEPLSEDESLHSQDKECVEKKTSKDIHGSTMTTSMYESIPSSTEGGDCHLGGLITHDIPLSMTQSIYGSLISEEEDTSQVPSPEAVAARPVAEKPTSEHKAEKYKSEDPIQDWGKPLGLPWTDNTNNFNNYLFWNPLETWGKPFGLPSPGPPPPSTLQTQYRNNDSDGDIELNLKPINKASNPKLTTNKFSSGRETSKTRDSSITRKVIWNSKQTPPLYVDLAYIPHHGNPYYTSLEFFKRIRARYYVFSSTDPSKDVLNALLEAKKLWDNPDLEVTIIPTYDTDVLGYWITENEEVLSNLKIDLAPSASRCTINLQDHDTSCSAYRLEF